MVRLNPECKLEISLFVQLRLNHNSQMRKIEESYKMMDDIIDKAGSSDYYSELELIYEQMKFLTKVTRAIEKYVNNQEPKNILPDKELRLYMKAIDKIESLRKAKRRLILDMEIVDIVFSKFSKDFCEFMEQSIKSFEGEQAVLIVDFLKATIISIDEYLKKHLV